MSTLTPRPIKDYCLGIYDGPHATPEESDEGPIFLGIKNITDDGRIDLSDVRHVSENQFPKWTRRVTPTAGDVVFTYEATLHRYAVIPRDFRGCLGRRVALVRPNTSLVDSRYLLYYFLSSAWRGVIEGNVMSGATVDRIPLERFPEFPVVLPGLDVQKRVVAVLSNYDDLIENNRRRMALLEDSARRLYREWFVRLRFPGHEHTPIVDGVPQGWQRRTLGEVCSSGSGIQTGPFGSQLHQADYSETGVPVVMPKDIIDFRVSDASIARIPEDLANRLGRHRMMIGDTVYGRRGDIGRRAYIGKRQQGWFCGTGSLRIRPDSLAINPLYLFDHLGEPATVGDITNRAKGSTMLNLSTAALKPVPILVPLRSLQDLYAEQVAQVREMLDVLDEQSQKLRQARDLLLPRLMSGELIV